MLKAIERSNLGRNVTIKGGVVMRSITGNVRRATEDLDLDFILNDNMQIENVKEQKENMYSSSSDTTEELYSSSATDTC